MPKEKKPDNRLILRELTIRIPKPAYEWAKARASMEHLTIDDVMYAGLLELRDSVKKESLKKED